MEAARFTRLTMFNTGEVDVVTWKRSDVSEYLTAAQSLLNMEVGTTGLAKKRKGSTLQLNVTAYGQGNSNGYEFVDKFDNYYLVIASDQHFYIFTAAPGMTFLQDISVPYTTADLDDIDYTQDNDTLILTHKNFPPARLYISVYNNPLPPTFAYAALNIYPYPAYDFNNINYNGFTVNLSVVGDVLTFEFTGVGADPGFTSAWVGGQIVGGGATDIDPIGYAIITAVSYSGGGGGTVTFTATVQIPFNTTTFSTQGSQYSIKQPAWSATLGYPAKVLFYQNRLWLANTLALNNTIFGSRINQPINYDVGTGRDTDAIVYTIGQTNSGSILWLNGGKQMEIYCQNLEFACPQDTNTALTPATFSVRQQSSYGSSPLLKPITYINDSYYLTKSGKALINYHFNGIGLTYQSSNISLASSHLVKAPQNRALLRGSDTSQDNFIYFLNTSDDTLTAFQFATEYKLAALTPVVFQEDVEIIDILAINNTIYMIKFYGLTNQYTVETFDNDTRVDCAFSSTMNSAGLVTGLSLLNGYVVQAVFQGQDYGQYLVVGGEITVINPSAYSGTITIGLLYDAELIPMYPFSGAAESPFMKQVQRIYVDYYLSLDFTVNDKLVPYQQFGSFFLTPQTDTAIIAPFSGWNRFDQDGVPIIAIRQSSPFDLVITSIGYEIASAII